MGGDESHADAAYLPCLDGIAATVETIFRQRLAQRSHDERALVSVSENPPNNPLGFRKK